jgi:uncharacterized protein (DUF433 family)
LYLETMSNDGSNCWQYLARKPGSDYQQLFVKGTRIAARTLYSYHTPGEDCPGQTVEELAADFNLPVEAVRESIGYCESDAPEIRADLAMEEALMEARGQNDPQYKYNPAPKILSPQEREEIVQRFRLERS